MSEKATPRPWRAEPVWSARGAAAGFKVVTAGGFVVATCNEHDAALIVAAVNAYDDTQAAIDAAVEPWRAIATQWQTAVNVLLVDTANGVNTDAARLLIQHADAATRALLAGGR